MNAIILNSFFWNKSDRSVVLRFMEGLLRTFIPFLMQAVMSELTITENKHLSVCHHVGLIYAQLF